MDHFTLIGLAAAACTTTSFLPQAVKVIKTKDARSLSLPMYIILTTGVILWLTYGILVRDIPVIAANAVTSFFSIVILGSIIFYRYR
ncbi:MAG: SemiSWEET transporter [Candidatus Aenigmatarchaeota archaeon]